MSNAAVHPKGMAKRFSHWGLMVVRVLLLMLSHLFIRILQKMGAPRLCCIFQKQVLVKKSHTLVFTPRDEITVQWSFLLMITLFNWNYTSLALGKFLLCIDLSSDYTVSISSGALRIPKASLRQKVLHTMKLIWKTVKQLASYTYHRPEMETVPITIIENKQPTKLPFVRAPSGKSILKSKYI